MAILKYQKTDGTIGYINQYNVIPTPVVQEKGQSTVDVMSQKAVTDELDFLKSYFEGKFDDLVTCDCPELSVELLSYVKKSELTETLEDYVKKDEIGEVDLTGYTKKSENTLARFNSAEGEIIPTLIVDEDAEATDGIGIYTKEQIDSKLSDFDNIYAKQAWVIQQIENIETGGEIDLSSYATKEELNTKPNVWIGSKDDYDGLGEYDNNTIYLIEIE